VLSISDGETARLEALWNWAALGAWLTIGHLTDRSGAGIVPATAERQVEHQSRAPAPT